MTYAIFIWHAAFLAITMSMIDLNTVFPALITSLGGSKIVFGLLYSIILGAPYLFNLVFGHFIAARPYRRKFLLIGIYLRAASFLGGLIVARAFSMKSPAFPANYALLLTIGSAGLVIASAAFFYLKRQKGSHMIDYAPG